MPSIIVEASTVAQQVAAERLDAAIRPTSINVEASGAAGDRVLRLQDRFTPAVSNGVPSPALQTVDRWRGEIVQGASVSLGTVELQGIKVLGDLLVIADVTDAGVFVTVGYEHDLD